MATKHIARARRTLGSRPGGRAIRARKYAKITLAVFFIACLIGIGLLVAEISTPGMAWYTYQY